jgi:hypothetical protein
MEEAKRMRLLFMDSATIFNIIVGVAVVLLAVTVIIVALDKQ